MALAACHYPPFNPTAQRRQAFLCRGETELPPLDTVTGGELQAFAENAGNKVFSSAARLTETVSASRDWNTELAAPEQQGQSLCSICTVQVSRVFPWATLGVLCTLCSWPVPRPGSCLDTPFVCSSLLRLLLNEDSHVPVLKSNWDTYLAYPSCLLMKHGDYFLSSTHISAEYLYESKVCLTTRETKI